MKLYVADYAPNPRRVRWLMAEKGIADIEVVTLDIMKHEHKDHPALIGAQAHGLPVLELDDGSYLAESLAIGRYLESLYHEPNLFGTDAREIAEIEMWTRRVELHFGLPLMWGTRLSHPALAVLEPPNAEASAYFLNIAKDFTEKLEARLEGRDFICADRLTVADIVAACAADFARIIRLRIEKDRPNLTRWLAAMRARPAAQTL